MVKEGERVGAVMKANERSVHLFGFGTYAGSEVPPKNVGLGIPNPKIELDNGKVVFGCECWWGPEDKVKAMLGGREIIEVNIEKVRG